MAACASEGEDVRERNYVLFFENEGDTWLAFRSVDMLGDLQEKLHVYRVGFDVDGEFAYQGTDDASKIPLANFEGASMEDYGPGPWRRLPGEATCD